MTAPALRKPRWPLVLAIVCAVAAGTVTWAWNTDSGYYAFLPDKAHPTAPIITVPGEKPQVPGSGLYFVDVSILKANEVQRLWAEHLVDGASLVPDDHILAPGENEQQRIRDDQRAMADSKTTAQVVAERAFGLDVKIDKLGAQITALARRVPGREGRRQAGPDHHPRAGAAGRRRRRSWCRPCPPCVPASRSRCGSRTARARR